jgi:rubrerythrin
LRRMDDPDAQIMLSEHLADETRHAWLWTQRIVRSGHKPLAVQDGYQTRIGKAVGLPRDLIDLLALTVVVEQRALRRYQRHLKSPDVDEDTAEVLRQVSKDEGWHIDWIRKYGRELSQKRDEEGRFDVALARFREIDERVTAELEEAENSVRTAAAAS